MGWATLKAVMRVGLWPAAVVARRSFARFLASPRVGRGVLLVLISSVLPALAACGPKPNPAAVRIGDPDRGNRVIVRLGCGACHVIPGVRDADGTVGPPLSGVAGRTFIAGVLPNTPQNMVRWIENPQGIVPGNAMPNMDLSDHDARDIAAYLETLR